MAMKIKKGDQVVVLTGKDKDQRGKVISVLPKENKVIVDGEKKMINRVVRHQKPRQTNRATPTTQTGRIEKPAPLAVSKLMVICPSCQQPSRLGIRVATDGNKVRTCKKCGKDIDGT